MKIMFYFEVDEVKIDFYKILFDNVVILVMIISFCNLI